MRTRHKQQPKPTHKRSFLNWYSTRTMITRMASSIYLTGSAAKLLLICSVNAIRSSSEYEWYAMPPECCKGGIRVTAEASEGVDKARACVVREQSGTERCVRSSVT